MLEVLIRIAEDKRLQPTSLHLALMLMSHGGSTSYVDIIATGRFCDGTVRRNVGALRRLGYLEALPKPTRYGLAPGMSRPLREVWDSSSDEARQHFLEEIAAGAPDDDDADAD